MFNKLKKYKKELIIIKYLKIKINNNIKENIFNLIKIMNLLIYFKK